MCDKVSYPSERLARQQMNMAKGRRGLQKGKRIKLFNRSKKKIPRRAYYCDECQAWHLTSTARKMID